MPLWKFRNVDEMNASTAGPRGDGAARLEALLLNLGDIITPSARRGVRKFRTMEEANEERAEREARQMKPGKRETPVDDLA
jgi:hypothetical protein